MRLELLRAQTSSVSEETAVHGRYGRGKLLATAGLVLSVFFVVLLGADRYRSAVSTPSANDVSQAVTWLRMGKAAGGKHPVNRGIMPLLAFADSKPAQGSNVFEAPTYSQVPGNAPTWNFTGHSHGAAGEPLTFGENTYHNAFDPDDDFERGPCWKVQTILQVCSRVSMQHWFEDLYTQ